MSTFANLLKFLKRLSAERIDYRLTHSRDNALMVEICVPGERWEVEYFDNGEIEVEVFASRNGIEGPKAIDELFERFGESRS